MLDWDSTNIVFTKRSLIEFLKGVFFFVQSRNMSLKLLHSQVYRDHCRPKLWNHCQITTYAQSHLVYCGSSFIFFQVTPNLARYLNRPVHQQNKRLTMSIVSIVIIYSGNIHTPSFWSIIVARQYLWFWWQWWCALWCTSKTEQCRGKLLHPCPPAKPQWNSYHRAHLLRPLMIRTMQHLQSHCLSLKSEHLGSLLHPNYHTNLYVYPTTAYQTSSDYPRRR